MEENNNKEEIVKVEENKLVSLDESFSDLSEKIIKETDPDKLNQLYNLFNTNQKKKNLLRIILRNKAIDCAEDELRRRLEDNKDEFTVDELLDISQILSGQNEKSQKYMDTIEDKPMLQINQNTQTVNVNIGDKKLSRESRDKVVSLFKELMKDIEKEKNQEPSDIIDVKEAESNSEGDK